MRSNSPKERCPTQLQFFNPQLYEWGCSAGVPLTQSITFYRCTSIMAARLKGLFEIFAADLLEDISDELKDSASQLKEEGRLNCNKELYSHLYL